MLRIIFIILLFAYADNSFAEDQADKNNLEALFKKLEEHPDKKYFDAKTDEFHHAAKGELGLPDPMVFFEKEDFSIGQGDVATTNKVGFEQDIPKFGLRGANSDKMQSESDKSKIESKYKLELLKAKLISLLAKLNALEEQENNLKLESALLNTATKSVAGRTAVMKENISAIPENAIDKSDLKIRTTELSEEKHEVHAELISLLGEETSAIVPDIKKKNWNGDVDSTYPVKIAVQDVAVAENGKKAQQAEWNPGFQIRGSYNRMDSNDNSGTIMAGMTIPLWGIFNQLPKVEAAKSAVRAAGYQADSAKRDVKELLDHLDVQIITSAKKIELLKQKLTQQDSVTGSMQREYESGRTDFAAYINSLRDKQKLKSELAEEKARKFTLIATFNSYIIGDSYEE